MNTASRAKHDLLCPYCKERIRVGEFYVNGLPPEQPIYCGTWCVILDELSDIRVLLTCGGTAAKDKANNRAYKLMQWVRELKGEEEYYEEHGA